METVKLSNGVEMPQVGYGVYQVEPEECEALVVDAINVGYRMIDTAQAYLNEEAVGSAWRKSGVSVMIYSLFQRCGLPIMARARP